jgi:hypothetical protein
MGARKRIQNIPKQYRLKCPLCNTKTGIKAQDSSPGSFQCKKCKEIIQAPITKCCAICAFSTRKCYPSLIMEAKIKGLEIR